MSLSKVKTGLIAVVIAAGVAVPLVIQHRSQAKIDAAVELIAGAQEPDGYLQTYFSVKAKELGRTMADAGQKKVQQASCLEAALLVEWVEG